MCYGNHLCLGYYCSDVRTITESNWTDTDSSKCSSDQPNWLSGSTTRDEPSASAARISSAATQQRLTLQWQINWQWHTTPCQWPTCGPLDEQSLKESLQNPPIFKTDNKILEALTNNLPLEIEIDWEEDLDQALDKFDVFDMDMLKNECDTDDVLVQCFESLEWWK